MKPKIKNRNKEAQCDICNKIMRSDNLKRHKQTHKDLLSLPESDMEGLSNFDIIELAKHLKVPNFRGVFMRDTLPDKIQDKECGVVNFNKSSEPGSHWVAYYKDGDKRLYFDSFGQVIPLEIQKYLKSEEEFRENKPVIQRNTDIVQKVNTKICGQLCVYVLDSLSKGANFQDIINFLKW